MKFSYFDKTPAGKKALILRVGVREVQLLRAMIVQAYQHTPKIPQTLQLRDDLKNMKKCLNSKEVGDWLDNHPDSHVTKSESDRVQPEIS